MVVCKGLQLEESLAGKEATGRNSGVVNFGDMNIIID